MPRNKTLDLNDPIQAQQCDLCQAEYEHAVIEAAKEAGVDPARALKAVGIDDPLGSLKTRN